MLVYFFAQVPEHLNGFVGVALTDVARYQFFKDFQMPDLVVSLQQKFFGLGKLFFF